jgi:Carboxypeptidase regulatory-like domain
VKGGASFSLLDEMKHFIAAVALCGCVLAQLPATDDRCAIEGQVLNGATGEPLKKAALMLRRIDRDQSSGTMTGVGGQFAIEDLDPGRYRLSVERNGFVRQEYGAHGPERPGTTLTLERGQRLRDIVVRLIPQAAITGRVVDEDSEPVANASVKALKNGYMRGKRQLVTAGIAQTNDLGEYRIHGLAGGKYYVMASFRLPEWIAEADSGEGYPATYYPGASDAATAAQLDVPAGVEMRSVDFTLRRARTVSVRGRVLNPPRGMSMNLVPQGSWLYMSFSEVTLSAGTEGGFEVHGVTPGSYKFLITFTENGKPRLFRPALEVGNSGVDGITISIPPAANLEGKLHLEGQRDINLASLSIWLQPREPMPGSVPPAHVQPDGSFTIVTPSPDVYDMNVGGLPAGGYYIKSVHLDDQDVLESGLMITGGAAKLDLVVSPAGGQVEGVVIDEKQQPAKTAVVTLIPDAATGSRISLFKIANTDQNGHYSIQGIAPGDYSIYAFEDLPPGANQDPDYMKPFQKLAESVTLREGGHEVKQLKQISAGETPPTH